MASEEKDQLVFSFARHSPLNFRHWRADLCEDEAFTLGHALCVKAIHGGKAKIDRIEAATIDGLHRGVDRGLPAIFSPLTNRHSLDPWKGKETLASPRGNTHRPDPVWLFGAV